MCKNEGLAVFRKPLVPLFKVCDLRRNLSDYIEKIIYSIRLMFCADFRKPSERSSREIQWDVSLFLIFNCFCVCVEPAILQTLAYLLRC